MQARDVQARVETLLDEPVRWATVKATLAANIEGPTARFERVARGRYGVSLPPRSSEAPSSIIRRLHKIVWPCGCVCHSRAPGVKCTSAAASVEMSIGAAIMSM
jgi:hypothetical protein